MIVWRICIPRHAALDGEGARLFGSRWTPRGVPVIFAAESLALAALERFVHAEPDFEPSELVALEIELDPRLPIDTLEPSALPARWRDYPPPADLADVGARWLADARSVALLVPSAIVPRERNVILNPRHPQFSTVRARATEPFSFDPRLWKTRR